MRNVMVRWVLAIVIFFASAACGINGILANTRNGDTELWNEQVQTIEAEDWHPVIGGNLETAGKYGGVQFQQEIFQNDGYFPEKRLFAAVTPTYSSSPATVFIGQTSYLSPNLQKKAYQLGPSPNALQVFPPPNILGAFNSAGLRMVQARIPPSQKGNPYLSHNYQDNVPSLSRYQNLPPLNEQSVYSRAEFHRPEHIQSASPDNQRYQISAQAYPPGIQNPFFSQQYSVKSPERGYENQKQSVNVDQGQRPLEEIKIDPDDIATIYGNRDVFNLPNVYKPSPFSKSQESRQGPRDQNRLNNVRITEDSPVNFPRPSEQYEVHGSKPPQRIPNSRLNIQLTEEYENAEHHPSKLPPRSPSIRPSRINEDHQVLHRRPQEYESSDYRVSEQPQRPSNTRPIGPNNGNRVNQENRNIGKQVFEQLSRYGRPFSKPNKENDIFELEHQVRKVRPKPHSFRDPFDRPIAHQHTPIEKKPSNENIYLRFREFEKRPPEEQMHKYSQPQEYLRYSPVEKRPNNAQTHKQKPIEKRPPEDRITLKYNQPQKEYLNQIQKESLNQPQKEYPNQAHREYLNQPQDEYLNHPQKEYLIQPQKEYVDQPKRQYLNQPLNDHLKQSQNEYLSLQVQASPITMVEAPNKHSQPQFHSATSVSYVSESPQPLTPIPTQYDQLSEDEKIMHINNLSQLNNKFSSHSSSNIHFGPSRPIAFTHDKSHFLPTPLNSALNSQEFTIQQSIEPVQNFNAESGRVPSNHRFEPLEVPTRGALVNTETYTEATEQTTFRPKPKTRKRKPSKSQASRTTTTTIATTIETPEQNTYPVEQVFDSTKSQTKKQYHSKFSKSELESASADDMDKNESSENYRIPSTTTTTKPLPVVVTSSTATYSYKTKLKEKYGNTTRPKFSIRDYRNRTTERTSEEPSKSSTTEREYGQRISSKEETSESNVENSNRNKYRPKYRPKLRTGITTSTASTTTTESTTTEKTNTFKPSRYKTGVSKYYNRYRSSTTTESNNLDEPAQALSSTKHHVTIKPLFAARRPNILQTRLANKENESKQKYEQKADNSTDLKIMTSSEEKASKNESLNSDSNPNSSFEYYDDYSDERTLKPSASNIVPQIVLPERTVPEIELEPKSIKSGVFSMFPISEPVDDSKPAVDAFFRSVMSLKSKE